MLAPKFPEWLGGGSTFAVSNLKGLVDHICPSGGRRGGEDHNQAHLGGGSVSSLLGCEQSLSGYTLRWDCSADLHVAGGGEELGEGRGTLAVSEPAWSQNSEPVLVEWRGSVTPLPLISGP